MIYTAQFKGDFTLRFDPTKN